MEKLKLEIEIENLESIVDDYALKNTFIGQKAVSRLPVMSDGKYVADVGKFPISSEILRLINEQIAEKIEYIKIQKEHLLVRCSDKEEFMQLYEFAKEHKYTGFNNEALRIDPKNDIQHSKLYHVHVQKRKIDLSGTGNFFIDPGFKYATRLDSFDAFQTMVWFEERK